MTRISVQGIGVVGAFGCGVAALARALEAGESPRSSFKVPTGGGPVELGALRADTGPLMELMPAKVLRRMDTFTRLGLLGARLALADAGLEPAGNGGLGLVLASGYGPTATTYALLDSMIEGGDACASPTHFAASLHNACAGTIAIALGADGPGLTVSSFELSVPAALQSARQWLLEGRAQRVLFGAVDELSDLLGYLWYRRYGLPAPGPLRPFQEGGALPGEGAAFLLLSRGEEGGYCALESVETGRDLEGLKEDPGLLILGADGRPETRGAYAPYAPSAACYTALYGSMPAAPAFDLAVGALLLRSGRAHPSPGAAGPEGGVDRVTVLTLGEDGGFGRVRLGR